MRLVTYFDDDKKAVGLLADGEVFDFERCIALAKARSSIAPASPTPVSVRELIGDKAWLKIAAESLSVATKCDATEKKERRLSRSFADVRLDLPIPDAAQFICVARNYGAHAAESEKELLDRPALFLRVASSLAAPGEPLIRPLVSDMFDWEGELAVVIGERCRHVAREEALSVVGGYAAFNDGSMRDWQRASPQWTAGKNFYRSGGFGAWVTTADEVADPSDLMLRTRLNGEIMQESTTAAMLFSIPEVISYISEYTELVPGDVIATGTPAGVGTRRTPPRYLDEGDVLEVEIENVALLRNPVVREK